MKKKMLIVFCLVLIVTSIGCGTIRGAGEDISTVGGWLVRSSDNVKEGH